MGGGAAGHPPDGNFSFHGCMGATNAASTQPTKITVNGFRNTRISSAMAKAPRFPTQRAVTPATKGMARARNKGRQGRDDTKTALIERAREKTRYGCATLPGIELMGRKPKLFVQGGEDLTTPRAPLACEVGAKIPSLRAVGLAVEKGPPELGVPKEVGLPKLFRIVLQNSFVHRAKQKFIKSSKLHLERTAAAREYTEIHDIIRQLQNEGYSSDESEEHSNNGDDEHGTHILRKKVPGRTRRNSMDGIPQPTRQDLETAWSKKSAQEEWDLLRGETRQLDHGVSEAVEAMLYEERFDQLGAGKLSRYQDIWTRRCALGLEEEVPLTAFCIALSRVNRDLVSPSQIEYCLLCLDFLQEMDVKARGAGDNFVVSPHMAAADALHNFDEFKLVAALSDRLKVFSEYTTPFFEDLDFTGKL